MRNRIDDVNLLIKEPLINVKVHYGILPSIDYKYRICDQICEKSRCHTNFKWINPIIDRIEICLLIKVFKA